MDNRGCKLHGRMTVTEVTQIRAIVASRPLSAGTEHGQMAKEQTTDAAATETLGAPVEKVQKTASVTLTSGTTQLYLLAERKPDGAVTTVNTIVQGQKGMTRGLTERHATMEAAKKRLATLADQAVAKGWLRKTSTYRGFVAKPDAFSEIPAPTAPAKGKGKSKHHTARWDSSCRA